ncbi:Alb1-domain-containing protein [Xylariales sp. AK1849]|nr:Alb1-domain-containing protein [Xylariales sp. AK1849]
MAKGTVSKRKALSKHSREARRATSPSIDTDKSLKNVKPPKDSVDHRPSILAIHHGAGVSKKQSKRGKNLSFKAKRRAGRDQDKAMAILERTEKKIANSKGSSRNMQTRRKTWDEINKLIPQDEKTTAEDDQEDEEEVSDFDDEMGEVQEANVAVLQAAHVPLPPAIDEDKDEIL